MARERTGWVEEIERGAKYRIRWYDPVASQGEGKRVYPSEMVHGSKTIAKRLLRAKVVKGDRREVTARDRRTLTALLASWLAGRRLAGKVRESTLRSYAEVIRLYVDAHPIGKTALADLTHDVLTAHYAQLRKPSGERPGISARVVRYAHTLIQAALMDAVKRDELARNPAVHVELPAVARSDTRWLTRAEAEALLRAAHVMDNDSTTAHRPLYPLLLLLVTTGLRPGEALALRWEDITDDVLRVRKNLVRLGENEFQFTDLKTKRSRRTVRLGTATLEALRSHRARQNEEKLRAGPRYRQLGLIFATELGTPLDRRNVGGRYFRAVLKRASLPATVRLYDLRHTCASALYADTKDAKKVASMLGHTNIRTTLDTYVHDEEGMEDGTADRLEELFNVGLAATA